MTIKDVQAIVNQIVAKGWMSRYDAMMGVLNKLDTRVLMELYNAVPVVPDREVDLSKSYRESMMEGIVFYFTK